MKSFTKAFFALGFAAAAAVTVYAQASEPPVAVPSSSEMQTSVANLAVQIAEDGKKVDQLQKVARKSKDVVKLTCVNDKVVEVKGERNLFDKSKQSFDTAIATSADAAQPFYVALAGSAKTVGKLRQDAEQCIGVPDLYKQESDAEFTDPNFPDDPTSDDPFEPDVEAPTYASEFGAT